MWYKTIQEALAAERPTDRIVKVLSNKFAIVESLFENGTYDVPAVAGLCYDQKIKFFGKPYMTGHWSLKLWIENRLETLPNVQMQATTYYGGITVFKWSDHRKYKQEYRKLAKLL